MEEAMLSRREAMTLAGVSYNGIRGWERNGRITPTRVMVGGVEEVRYPRSQVEEIVRERRVAVGVDDSVLEVEKRQLRDQVNDLKERLRVSEARYDKLLDRFLEMKEPQK